MLYGASLVVTSRPLVPVSYCEDSVYHLLNSNIVQVIENSRHLVTTGGHRHLNLVSDFVVEVPVVQIFETDHSVLAVSLEFFPKHV